MERMLASLLVIAFASVQTAAAAGLVASPLLGSPGGGDPFDDGVTAVVPHVVQVASLLICHGDSVDGIQANYTLQDGSTLVGFTHGMKNKDCTKQLIEFKEGEMIVGIEGKTLRNFGYVSQLTFFTAIPGGLTSTYGPFGRSFDSNTPFSVSGTTVGFFGRTGQVMDAIGLYIDSSVPLTLYKKSDLIGGDGGDDFDDFSPADNSERPSKISSMIVNYGQQINGIKVTYELPSGASSAVLHGDVSNFHSDGILDFDPDEWITRVDLSSGPVTHVVNYLMIQTTNSKGSVRSYGPFGLLSSTGNVTTIYGIVYGFYGRSGKQLNALGFYI